MSGSADAAPSAPICIDSDDALDAMGLPGNGTEGNPYLLADLQIDATGNGYAIYLNNINKHLVITECTLENAGHAGIEVWYSSNIWIQGNTIRNNVDLAIQLYLCNNISMSGNDCWNNPLYGIAVRVSSDIEVVGNYFTQSTDGINLNFVERSTFSGNLITSMSGNGIYLEGSGNNTIFDNKVNNSNTGIMLYGSNLNRVLNNTCIGNVHYGISLVSTNGNVLYGNLLVGNNGATSVYDPMHVQAFDDGTNRWNLSSTGNRWGDWAGPDADDDGIVDEPYLIEGGSAADRLPQAVSLMITSPVDGSATKDASIWLSGTSSSFSEVAQVAWRNDASGGSGVCSGTEEWTATITLVEGVNLITVTMEDLFGIEVNQSVSVVLDTTSPSLSITSPAEGAYVGSGPTVTWIGSDSGTGVVYYIVSIEGLLYQNTTADSLTIDNLADGTYTVLVSAYDGLGNCKDEVVTFIVDTAAPSVVIGSPINDSSYATDSITLSWTGGDAGSGVDRYEVSWEGGSAVALQSSVGSYTFTGLGDGSHVLTVIVYDKAGMSSTDAVTVIVDTHAPSLTIISPAPGSYFSNGDVTVSWLGNDTGTGIAYYHVSIESLAFINTTGTSYTFSDLVDGTYTVLVSAYDDLGNYRDETVMFTVDTEAPTVWFVSPAEGALVNASAGIVEWEGQDARSGLNSTLLRVDGGEWTELSTATIWTYDLEDGTHTIEVKVTDLAGNSASATLNITVDTVAPEAEVSPIGEDLDLDQIVLIEFSEPMNHTSVSVVVSGVTGTLEWEGNAAIFAPSALSFNRAYNVLVSGKDLAGNHLDMNWTFATRSVGNLTGVILDENGDPVANVTVTAGGEFTAVTDENGRFVFLNLSVGTYQFEVDAEGYEPFTFNATVEQGATADEGTVEMVPENTDGEDDGDVGSIWSYLIIAIAVLAAVGVAAFVLLRKR